MGKCHNSVVINASKQEVWNRIADFHDMSWTPNIIENVEKIGNKGGYEVGAQRILNGAFRETLQSVNAKDFTIEYTIDDGPGPLQKDHVESYRGKIQLVDTDEGTEVIWSSEYVSEDDNAVGELCNPVYQGMLKDLAAEFS